MSQWAEIRHLYFVEHVPLRAIGRRLGVDRKTVKRVVGATAAPAGRRSPPRGRRLDPYRGEIEALLRDERRLTAKRIGALLRERHPDLDLRPRAVRRYVASVRLSLFAPEAFVHRTHVPGTTLEADFGETWVEIAGEAIKARFFVATLPASNAYFARLYPVERLECLFDGLLAAFRYFGGLSERVVMDNTSLAVREVLRGPEREENRAFQAFRGELALAADFCAPRKGWEKGSVEGGVGYVRENALRPRLVAASFEEANARLASILEADLDLRRLPDGRTCREALEEERRRLRPLPEHLPDACRTLPRVVDKFGHVLVDAVRYSVPIECAYRPALVRLFPDRIDVHVDDARVASHPRSFRRGTNVLDARHVLTLLARKRRAAGEATALLDLPPVFEELRVALREQTRRPEREWVEVLKLLLTDPQEEVEAATRWAIERGSPRLATIRMILRREEGPPPPASPVSLTREDLAAVSVEKPDLSAYDALAKRAS
jgi:transposase